MAVKSVILGLSIFLFLSGGHCEDFYEGCGETKGCFGMPKNCVSSKDCNVAFSYKKQDNGEDFEFALMSEDFGAEEYIAVGLSEDQNMRNDAVIACTSSSELQILAHWNFYYYSIPLENPKANIYNEVIKHENGKILCSFTYKSFAEIHVPPPASFDVTLNLNEQPFHLLLSKGPMKDGKIQYHAEKMASDELIQLWNYKSYLKVSTSSIYDGCGTEKGCFGMPENCIQGQNCDVAMTYVATETNLYHFTIEGAISEDQYIAMGFGIAKGMGPALVIACKNTDSDSKVALHFNKDDFTNNILQDPNQDLSNGKVSVKNGIMQCSFDLQAKADLPLEDSEKFALDLNNQEYHLLLALGALNKDKIHLAYHSGGRICSNDMFLLSEFNSHQSDSIYEGCGDSKGCFGLPKDCVASQSCDVIMTYKGVQEKVYHMELQGKATEDQYLAMGFGQAQKMSPAAVVACMNKDSDKVPKIAMYLNKEPHSSTIIDDPENSNTISNGKVELINGVMKCTFNMQADTNIPDLHQTSDLFKLDLNTREYHLLLAYGQLDNDFHTTQHINRIASDEAFLLADFNSHYESEDPIYKGCGDSKGCFGFTKDCIAGKNCDVVLTYSGTEANLYHMELQGKISDDQYVAAGFGTAKAMSPTAVVACTNKDSDQVPKVSMYFNQGPQSTILANPTLAISNGKVEVENGVLKCSFDIKASAEIPIPQGNNEMFDLYLNSKEYHLLLAYGPLDKDDHLDYHTKKTVSDETFLLGNFNSFRDPIYQGCGDTKGCFGLPSGCESSKNCSILATYSQLENMDVDFEIFLKEATDKSYVALALSSDDKMGDDSVVFCFNPLKNGSSGVGMSWNKGHSGSPIIAPPYEGIKNPTWNSDDGTLKCSFKRSKLTTIQIPNENKEVSFDLQNSFYLLLASGDYKLDDSSPLGLQLNYHTIKGHSKFSIDFSDNNPNQIVDIYEDCGSGKGCFGDEQNCLEHKNCSMVTRFYGASNASYIIEIFADLEDDNEYVATALSFDKLMGNDSAMACILNKTTNQPDVQMYWNFEGQSKPLENPLFGIKDVSGKFVDGKVYCKLEREALLNIPVPNDQNEMMAFDMNSDHFYLLMASGPLNGALIGKHDMKAASNSSYDFSNFNPYLDDTYSGCGIKKGCFGLPSGCVTSRDCSILTTYAQRDNGDVDFEIRLAKATQNSYAAVALSDDKEMGDDSVMFCYPPNASNDTGMAMSWNKGHSGSDLLDKPRDGLADMKVTLMDGSMSCYFSRRKITIVDIPDSDQTATFDLSKAYFLLLAFGDMTRNAKSSGIKLNYHEARGSSNDAIDFSEFKIVTEAAPTLVLIHGSLMIIAWFVLASTGMLTARYAKGFKKELFGKLAWFRIHQFCMILTWILTITAVVIIFIEKKTDPLERKSVHAIVGLISAIFAFVQPFMAAIRPAPDSTKRIFFNVAHFSLGTTAFILALVAILLATQLDSMKIDANAALIIVIAMKVLYGIVHLTLTIGNWILKGKRKGYIIILLTAGGLGSLTLAISLIYFLVSGQDS